jgi:hypothetical protein
MSEEEKLPKDYIEGIEHLANTLSKLNVELADKGCITYEQANQVQELITGALISLANKTWKDTRITRSNINKSANIIMDAWENCKKNKEK